MELCLFVVCQVFPERIIQQPAVTVNELCIENRKTGGRNKSVVLSCISMTACTCAEELQKDSVSCDYSANV